MRNKPLSVEETETAQKLFELISHDQQQTLVSIQDQIESCEGVDMAVEITGGIPYEHWCLHCKRRYAVMYALIQHWYTQLLARPRIPESPQEKSRYDHPMPEEEDGIV
jgi:hypothetical protein